MSSGGNWDAALHFRVIIQKIVISMLTKDDNNWTRSHCLFSTTILFLLIQHAHKDKQIMERFSEVA